MPILNYYLLCYFNTTIQLLNQIITVSLSGNREYNTGSKDTTNADQPDLLSALSKVESNLIQNITNLKDEVINLKDIINKNLQDENKRVKIQVNVLKNKIVDLEIEKNNVDQYSRWNIRNSSVSMWQSTRRKRPWNIESNRCKYYYEWNREMLLEMLLFGLLTENIT